MIDYEIADEFDVDVEGFWAMFFSDEYNDALWPAIDVERTQAEFRREGEGDDEVIHRVVDLVPQRDVPAALKKIVKGAIGYQERNVFRRRDNTMEVVTIPTFFSDRFESTGTFKVVPAGEGRCRRVYAGKVACSVPLVGRKVERIVVDEVEQSYTRSTAFTRKWIKDHAG